MWYFLGVKRITKVEALEDYRLHLEFADGVTGIADVAALAGKGVFALWNDYAEFRKVQIGSSGELVWGDQLDLCPDALYMKVTGQQPEETFPSLNLAAACA
jgi:hypothetical protein